jgi:hypothetical protein
MGNRGPRQARTGMNSCLKNACALWRVNGQATGQCRGLQDMRITGRRDGRLQLGCPCAGGTAIPRVLAVKFEVEVEVEVKVSLSQTLKFSIHSATPTISQLGLTPARRVHRPHHKLSPNGIAAAPAIVKEDPGSQRSLSDISRICTGKFDRRLIAASHLSPLTSRPRA